MKQDLLLKKGQLVNEANEILKTVHDQKREALSAEEETKFNAIHADIEKISKHVAMIEKQELAERGAGQQEERLITPSSIPSGSTHDTRSVSSRRDHQDALRAWLLAPMPGMDMPSQWREAAKRTGVDLNSRYMTFRMSGQPLASRAQDDIERWQKGRDEERALSGPQSSTSAGGYFIQDALMREVEVALLQFGGMRQVSQIIRTETGGPLPIPTVNDTTNLGALIAEGTTVGTQDTTISQLVLDAYTYTSKSVLVSRQLLQDNGINVPQLLGRILGERIARKINRDYTLSTGTGEPNGVVNAATFSQATTGNTTGITYANLLALYHSLDPAYRPGARFMMNDNSLSKIKSLVDSQGRPLWLPNLVSGAPDTIFGAPISINQDMATMTISAKSIIFGDFSKYLIRDVLDITLLRLDERYAEFLQVAFLAFMRTDGDLLNAGTVPVRGYQNST